MARKSASKTVKRDGLVIVNPAASSVPVDSSSPFTSTPATVSPGDPIQPLTVPASRQIVAGGAVRIVKSKGI